MRHITHAFNEAPKKVPLDKNKYKIISHGKGKEATVSDVVVWACQKKQCFYHKKLCRYGATGNSTEATKDKFDPKLKIQEFDKVHNTGEKKSWFLFQCYSFSPIIQLLKKKM